jgi:opacity protein-like surface antigen
MHGSRTSLFPRSVVALAIAGVAVLASVPAAAQNAIPSVNDWQFEFVPYIWGAGVRSDVKLGQLPSSTLSVSSSSLLKALDFAAMGTIEARKGDWGGFFDAQYIKLGVGNQFGGGLLGGYNVDMQEQIYTLAGTYRVVNNPSMSLDLLAGARYATIKTTVDANPSLLGGPGLVGPAGRVLENDAGWWNGIIGVKTLVPVNDRWSLLGYADVGSGSGTTSWQVVAGASYQYSPATSIKFGYRALSFKRDDEATINKMTMYGPYVGLGFKF